MQSAKAATDTTMATPTYDASLPKGRVVDSITCKDGSQDFALYLPAHYNPAQAYPCIYFFDPHGHGGLPLRMYKELAEQYGFVLVGSNASKNGMQWQVTNNAAQALIADTKGRINIDPKRIYAAGFSGGSRVASSVALMDGGIAGVIGCGAGFPNGGASATSRFDYFGMVGDQDFNLIEMRQLDSTLEQNNFDHELIVFSGKHAWAPAADFSTALLWMQVYAIKEHLQPKDDALVAALKSDYDKRLAAAILANDLVKVNGLLYSMIQTLGGLTDVAPEQKRLADLAAGNAFKKAAYTQYMLQQNELQQQQQFAKHFTALDGKWWTQKIAQLEHDADGGKTPDELMNRRLLNYLGLVSYMSSNHAIQENDMPNAELYLKVFKMADPQNPDQRYLTAQYYIKKGDNTQAVASLKEAAALGFSDVSQLLSDPAFTGFQGDAGYQEVVKKVRTNAVK